MAQETVVEGLASHGACCMLHGVCDAQVTVIEGLPTIGGVGIDAEVRVLTHTSI
jgi:hypothetical protein